MADQDVYQAADRLPVPPVARDFEHRGGTFPARLRRTPKILAESADDSTQLAGLCHAAYNNGLLRPLQTLNERPTLELAIHDQAEAVVYLNLSRDRRESYARLGYEHLVLMERFAGSVAERDASKSPACTTATVANDSDAPRHGERTSEFRSSVGAHFRAVRPSAPGPADLTVSAA